MFVDFKLATKSPCPTAGGEDTKNFKSRVDTAHPTLLISLYNQVFSELLYAA